MPLTIKKTEKSIYLTDNGSAFDKDVLHDTDAYWRWWGVLLGEEDAYNIQIHSQPTVKPSNEDNHIRLTLVDQKEGTKEFTITETLQQFLGRDSKFIEFFTTRADGTKVGVSLEWVKRDELYLRGHTTDKEIEQLTEPTKKAFDKLAMTGKPQEVDVSKVVGEEET